MAIAQIITALITVFVAVIGWIVAHYFSSKRDRRMKRRELITSYLINAYRVLTIDITQRDATPEWKQKLEAVIADLQLFGSPQQITMAKQLADDVNKGGDFYMDDLINDLRDELREELDLFPVVGNVRWLRFKENKF